MTPKWRRSNVVPFDRNGCQTHEELKILVSKFNRRNNIKADVWGVLGISVQESKY
jgi:hypothetical protein